jgi:hypothetical protein
MSPRLENIVWATLVVLLLVRYSGGSIFAPAVDGPLRVVIVRESLDDTPAMARLITALRNGPAAEYLTTKGHALDVLDDDHPSVVADWTEGVQLPAVAVLDGKTQQVLYREPLPATADELVKWLQGKGA